MGRPQKFESKTRFEIRYSIPHEYGQFQGVGLIIQSDMSHDDRWHILSKLEDPEWDAAIGAYIAYSRRGSMKRRKIFVNFDKAGAEWVVVAYLSGDARMIDVIESGKSPHLVTGALISGCPEELVLREHKLVGDINDPYQIEELRATLPDSGNPDYFLPRSMSIRQAGKKSNHALNYDEGYRVFALYNEMEEGDAKKIVDFYKTRAYPGVPLYHEAIRRELKNEHRTLVSCFGRKVVLRGAWDAKTMEGCLLFQAPVYGSGYGQ